jgi:hypothetical protein
MLFKEIEAAVNEMKMVTAIPDKKPARKKPSNVVSMPKKKTTSAG